ncbi:MULTISPECIES: tyrosine-type recombinase/integrase [unclassified Streptomyces]|uniref:tyrosine-type recombinase/integrase n=1 Tax=unclassified Streptomyces TaxID=2593676 RepID=UPI0003A2B392|nr:tyrosine-type recombinase/integrase [Streptomyces sp. LaPpAH-202]MYW61347.1 tyrosine-type recombinase/integrase [Streptomyces sp. SID8370]MYW87294.1 tyrosine-type recombinase/integrase [Streptomyces sp. SID8371]
MARVWIEDRAEHTDYVASLEKWQAAKKAGSKRQPPGRWRVRWYGPDQKGKAKTFGKLPQAEAERDAIAARLDKGSYRDPKSAKAAVKIVAEEWFTSKRRIGRTTRRDYRDLLDNYVIPRWGTWQVGAVQWEDVNAWLTDLETQPGKSGRPLGAARVIKAYRVLAMVMKHAVFSKRIATSPCHDHELPRPDDEDEHVYLTYDELERLAEAAGEYRLLILTLGYCGIRWAEASAIKVGRLSVPTRRIRIVQNYTDVSGRLELGPVKNHEKRSVPLPRSFADELGTLSRGKSADVLLFSSPEGKPLRYANFRSRVFDPAVKAAGLEGRRVTPHKLRHTAASLAIAAKADVKVVQTMLGHKDASMTLNIYGHLFPDRLDEVADALDAGRKVALALADAPLS